jgi:hypothetical protein
MPVAPGEALLPFIAAACILFTVRAGDGRGGGGRVHAVTCY